MPDGEFFSSQPFGFSFGNRRPTDGRDAFGPPDPVEDNRLGKCPKCGLWSGVNRDGTMNRHDDELGFPCRAFRWTPKETDRA